MIEDHPKIVKTVVQLRRDVIEQEIKTQKDITTFALSSDSFTNFYDLFYILKKEQKYSDIFKRDMIVNIDTLLKEFVDLNPSLIIRR